MDKLRLVVGLGNLGKQYAETRHNAGFKVIDRLLSLYHVQLEERNNLGEFILLRKHKVVLAKPNTYMNHSGKFVKWACQNWNIKPDKVMVVYDELAFPLGTVRLKMQGSANNHNGIKSVIAYLNTEHFNRLRFGIKSDNTSNILHEVVMSEFTPAERNLLETALTKAIEALKGYIDGVTMLKLMEVFNA